MIDKNELDRNSEADKDEPDKDTDTEYNVKLKKKEKMMKQMKIKYSEITEIPNTAPKTLPQPQSPKP